MTRTLPERPGPPGSAEKRPAARAARLPVRLPRLQQHGAAGPAAGDRVLLPRRGRSRLPRLHRRGPAGPGAAQRPCRAASRRLLREPALGKPDLRRVDRTDRAGPARGPGALQRAAAGVRGHLHPERHRRVPAGRGGLPVRPADPAGPDAGQSQLGQRHPGVRQVTRRDHAVRAVLLARAAGGRRRGPPGPGTAQAGPAGRGPAGGALRGGALGRPGIARPAAAVAGRGRGAGRGSARGRRSGRLPPPRAARLPGAKQLQRGTASPELDRAGPRARLRRAAGRGGVRAGRTGWTCPWSSPISCRSAGTRCSATRPASAA